MRVARSLEPRAVRIEEVEDPRPGPEDVLCDVRACGVCATDVTDWYVADRLPAVLGHEVVGTVRAVGERVEVVQPGERVVIHHHAACGECRRCRRGHETMCERFRASGLDPGGFAEQVRVPAELVDDLLVLPAALDDAAAVFVEPLGCVLRAQDRAGLRAGASLLVVGAGVNGLLQIAAAHARGVEVVWVREPRPERLALALEWGGERHGNEAVDVAVVCTPEPDAIAGAAQALAPGGTLLLYAPPAPSSGVEFDASDLFLRELTITTSYAATARDMRAALALLARGRIDPAPLVSHTLPLEEVQRALSLQREGAGLKVVVVPPSA